MAQTLPQINHAVRLSIRRSLLAPFLRRIARRGPLTSIIESARGNDWSAAADRLLSRLVQHQGLGAGFHDALRSRINHDTAAELLLTAVRKRLLLGPAEAWQTLEIQELAASLLQQCINNEYVWFVSDEERALLERWDEELRCAGTSQAIEWRKLFSLAMYRSVHEIADGRFPELFDRAETMPDTGRNIVGRHLAEIKDESSLRDTIRSYGAIEREASRKVAATYERYPYPRWLDWDFPPPGTRARRLRHFFSPDELDFCSRPFNVLVAGCGTGSKAIGYAIGYGPHARITAVDLSRTSLAYGARMARSKGLRNIDFLQMDLLDLPKLQQEFDVVECTGVLHHLEDPLEGGRAITSRVRSGGLVHISLYSELARRGLVRLRLHYGLNPNASDDDVRAFRRRLMTESPQSIERELGLRGDFFDLSRCRDLLFHPLEHRFTLPGVGKLLDHLGVEFRGLQRPDLIPHQYWTPYPPDTAIRDLLAWHRFEMANPDAFT
ncbi:MAG TPA: class I SAM-dependent methyltransferase, partial [Woeseiaceae bacterium]|nr:class I SAM-dependent methyltransferase [Woeseiaceae bacterium]